MSEQNEKLTATSIKSAWSGWNDAWAYRDRDPTTFDAFKSGAEWLAKQVEHATAELKERIKKLEETSILRVQSITIIAEGYRKEAAELREKLREAEEDAAHKTGKWSEWDKMLCSERHAHEKKVAELRKELERQKEIAESLAKERWSLRDELAEAQRQRDEANTILRKFKRLAAHGNLQDLADFDAKVCDHLSRLSSEETKPNE